MKISKKSLRTPDYLQHMLDAIQQIESYTAGIAEEEFLARRLLLDAVVRNIEIIGEAANNVMQHDPVFAGAHPDLSWNAMYAMRNRLSHGYFSVDARIVWRTVQQDLPILKIQLQTLLQRVAIP